MGQEDAIVTDLERVYKELKELAKRAKASNLYGMERTLLHVMSHLQTLLEGLKKTEAGFAL